MINQAQFLEKYNDKSSNYFLVDVRTPYEFEDHHLPGTVNIPVEELQRRLAEIPQDRPVITICEHGVRSSIAEKFLRAQDYSADSLERGLSGWKGTLEHS
jgi:rhodanese-related sulfurtransferase